METDNETENMIPRWLRFSQICDKIKSGEYQLSNVCKSSKCWTIFARIMNENGEEIKGFVYCRVCEKVYSHNNPSTSNLIRHKCYTEKFVKKPESPISNIELGPIKLEEKTHLENINDINNNLMKSITKLLIKDCQPYSFLEYDNIKALFQEFISFGAKFGTNIDIDKLLPSTTEISKKIGDTYGQCFKRVKEEIVAIKENGFGLVTDICRDNISSKSYIALTIHFYKNETLTYRLLGLRSMETDMSINQNIQDVLKDILKNFDLKLSTKSIILTNRDAEIFNALQDTQNIPCISSLLKSSLEKCLESVPKVAALIRSCSNMINFLKSFQLNDSLNASLPCYNANDWASAYNMLKWIETKWNDITEILQEQNELEQIKVINIDHLKAINQTLQPFEEAIDNLEQDNTATIHLVLIYLHELKKSCEKDNKDIDFIKSLKLKLRQNLEKISMDNITILHKIAIFLYPPTNKLLKFSEKDKKLIEDECLRLMKYINSESQPIIKQECKGNVDPVSKKKRLFLDFLEPETNCDPNELIIRELQCYKNTRVAHNEDFDVFSWWEVQKDNFPLLSKLSYSVFATPASSVTVQRVLSSALKLLRNMDSETNERKVEQIIFINSNAIEDEFEIETESQFSI